MNTTTTSPRRKLALVKARAAFSLVELLVVIAVIGIIAAIAIPNIAGINDQATSSKNARNAQSVASTFAAARAAGFSANGIANVDDAIDAMVAGANGTQTFANTQFKVPMSGAEVANLKTAATTYLSFNATSGSLDYKDQ